MREPGLPAPGRPGVVPGHDVHIRVSHRHLGPAHQRVRGKVPRHLQPGRHRRAANGTDLEYVGAHLRRQLSFDLWYLFIGFFILAISEGPRIQNGDFSMFAVLFEIVSAYGTVGLSLGYPNVDASLCSQFNRGRQAGHPRHDDPRTPPGAPLRPGPGHPAAERVAQCQRGGRREREGTQEELCRPRHRDDRPRRARNRRHECKKTQHEHRPCQRQLLHPVPPSRSCHPARTRQPRAPPKASKQRPYP